MGSTFLGQLENKLLQPVPDLSGLNAEDQYSLIVEKAGDGNSIVPAEGLLEKLRRSKQDRKPLVIKFGIDPTGSEIHLGHAISLINLRRFKAMGHRIILVIGDFTAMIGDPGERMDSRPTLTEDQVQENMRTYKEQAAKILDLDGVEQHYNSEWLKKLSLSDWIKLTKGQTVNSLVQRRDFKERLESGQPLSLAEFEYALLMGYDSVVLKPDIEVGGQDQYLNFHFCRAMMDMAQLSPEVFVTYDLLPGTSGQKDAQGRFVKMSKSRNNYIPIMAGPADVYGKVMSIPDDVMWIWYKQVTEIRKAELDRLQEAVNTAEIHPKQAKQLLARVVVATLNNNDMEVVAAAEKDFNEKFGKAAVLVPENIECCNVNFQDKAIDVVRALIKKTGSEIRRLTEQKGLYRLVGDAYEPLTTESLLKPTATLLEGTDGNLILKVGKKQFFKLLDAHAQMGKKKESDLSME